MLLTDFVVDSPALTRLPGATEAAYVYESVDVDVSATPPVVRPQNHHLYAAHRHQRAQDGVSVCGVCVWGA